jgi:uncharacterized membrane protein
MGFVDTTIEVAADVRDAYGAWTAFEEYPEFMDVIESVEMVQDDQLHWVALVEDDVVEWDSDLFEVVPEEKVAWRAIDGRESGQVKFEKLGEGKTRIHYQLEFDPEAWDVDVPDIDAWMQERVDSDLAAFKEYVENPPTE